jgi:hypothetical protein
LFDAKNDLLHVFLTFVEKGVPLGFSTLFQKIYPRARFELPSRRHCSEKHGAVAALYRPGIEGTMKMSTSKHSKNTIV